MSLVLTDTPSQGIRVLTLNRPEKKNALSDDVLSALADALAEAVSESAVRAIVLTGSDTCFAAGADINRFRSFDAVTARNDTRPLLWERIAACPKPLIAAVENWCLGAGAELALHCDIVVAGKSAQFGLPEVTLGIIPGAGGTQRLPRSLSKTDAMLMVLTGGRFEAERARQMGLVSVVAETGKSLDKALEIAKRIARNAPIAVENAKRSVLRAYDTGLSAGLSTERDLYLQTFGTDDQKEGVNAFQDKRKPVFNRA
jgi:enoyl-CoA hydratase